MRNGRNLVVHAFILGVAFICVLSAGCKQRQQAKPKVALVMKSLANEFFKTMADGARTHQAEHADEYELAVVGIKNELDVAQQIQFVELMIAQQVNAIVIAPADSRALVAVCKRAMDAGIIVVNIDNKFDETVLADKGVKIPFVGPDNRKGARLAGEYLAKKLKPGDDVAIIEGAPNTFNGIQRKLGFEDAMKPAGMDIVSSQSGYWEMEKANQVVSGVIIEHPQLKAILCSNDSMALGALAALKAAGRANDVLLVGFDNISAVQKLLKAGEIVCTIDQHADKLAVYGIDYALEMLKNKSLPADRETPVDLITAETLR
ncbi:MAG: sugar ABC transporter substrate-binding protein [Sedimentisphaerales bacterium]|nr:sugar ABC transporter substrate-binding protein [Sedimentisphaerales bacterium]